MILCSHPTGNAYVRQSLQALAENALLTEFWTCINWNPDGVGARLLPTDVTKQLMRRTFTQCDRRKARAYPWREVGRLLAPHFGLAALTKHETGPFSVDAVFRSLDRKVAARLARLPDIAGVYAGEDGACETFRRAKIQGAKRFYDLPIGYWKVGHAIYAEEKEREPEWAATLTGVRDSPEKLARKDEEIELADVIFVASAFTRETLEACPGFAGKVQMAPYGAPPAIEEPQIRTWGGGKLKILFAGSLTQRKGLSYLLRAVEPLRMHVELTIIGRKTDAPCAPLETALREHRCLDSLPHSEILAEMRCHDILIFPSLFEGFGLVILEAMSQGLPVITTPHTAGPDVITDGLDGFIVPIRSAEAITTKIGTLLEQPQILAEMKHRAWRRAKQCSWAGYRKTLIEAAKAELGA